MFDNDVSKIKKLKSEAYYKLLGLCGRIVENILKQDFNKNNINEKFVTCGIVDVISGFIINKLTKGTNTPQQNKIECNKIINSYLSDKLDKKVNININFSLITDNIVRTNEYIRYKFLCNKLKDMQK